MCSHTGSIKSNILTVIHTVQFWYELLLAECSGEGFSACRRSSLELYKTPIWPCPVIVDIVR